MSAISKSFWHLAIVLGAVLPVTGLAADTPDPTISAPKFQTLSQAPWTRMLPDLNDASPEISIVHVDPGSGATQLYIRTPRALHVRQHWHSANETHTMITGTATFGCDGKKVDLGPGDFNYMPSRMAHEAWTSAGSVVFITTDRNWDINWVDGPPTSADLIK